MLELFALGVVMYWGDSWVNDGRFFECAVGNHFLRNSCGAICAALHVNVLACPRNLPTLAQPCRAVVLQEVRLVLSIS